MVMLPMTGTTYGLTLVYFSKQWSFKVGLGLAEMKQKIETASVEPDHLLMRNKVVV